MTARRLKFAARPARIDFICCTDGIRDGAKSVAAVCGSFAGKAPGGSPVLTEFRVLKSVK